MSVSLPPEFEEYVAQVVASGQYASTEDAVREALRLLQDRDRRLQQLRDDVRAGFEQLERGESTEYDDAGLAAFFQEIEDGYEQRAEAKRLADS